MQPVILDTDVASLSHKRKLIGPLAARLIGGARVLGGSEPGNHR